MTQEEAVVQSDNGNVTLEIKLYVDGFLQNAMIEAYDPPLHGEGLELTLRRAVGNHTVTAKAVIISKRREL